MSKIKDCFSQKKSKLLAFVSMACLMMAASAVTAFADEVTPAFPVTSEMLSGVTTMFNSAVTVSAPIGIGIMGVILGINFVPKLIKKLAK